MMKHTDSDKGRSVPGPVTKLRRRWQATSALIIFLWAGWALLDAFVIPRDIIAVEEAGAAPAETADARPAETADIQPAETADAEPADSTGPEANLLQGNDSEALSEPEHEKTEYGEAEPEMDEAPAAALDEPVITDSSYDDGSISIRISTMRRLDTDIYIADITVDDPDCLRTALAGNAFGRNLTDTTSSIAREHNAILAINGDYYGFRDAGYVMRGGYLYRELAANDQNQEDLVILEDGTLQILAEVDYTAQEMQEMGARDIFSFGPGLIIDGQISVREGEEVDRAQVTNPRTAIGVLSPLHYIFVVSDGRTDESVGLSLLELAQLMQDLGCTLAYNLDGGGSSTIWFNGKVLNRPTTFGDKISERKVSDIIYIGK